MIYICSDDDDDDVLPSAYTCHCTLHLSRAMHIPSNITELSIIVG